MLQGVVVYVVLLHNLKVKTSIKHGSLTTEEMENLFFRLTQEIYLLPNLVEKSNRTANFFPIF